MAWSLALFLKKNVLPAEQCFGNHPPPGSGGSTSGPGGPGSLAGGSSGDSEVDTTGGSGNGMVGARMALVPVAAPLAASYAPGGGSHLRKQAMP
jgi:hypothetical protein